ncbi:hypothetical protein ACV229_15505 [Burkholderia sp. MR1-5-21]
MKTMRCLATNAAACLLATVLVGSALAQTPPAGAPSGAPAGGAPGGPPGAPTGPDGKAPPIPAIPPVPANAPKASADSRNFEGTWYHEQMLVWRNTVDMYGSPLPFNDRGKRLMDRRVKATYIDKSPVANASAECLPPGQPWQMDLNFPFQVYQNKDGLSLLFQEYHGAWHIRLNGQHRKDGAREYFGDSVAHWEGDTLVVDTTNYRRSLWMDVDGTPVSVNAHLVFRIRKINYGDPKLEIVVTVDDPTYYSRPWSLVRLFAWRPDMANFSEYNCEYQVGAPGGVSRYGLVPEAPEETP